MEYFWGDVKDTYLFKSVGLLYISQGLTYLFGVLSWKFTLSQHYVGWIKMKTYSPTNCRCSYDHVFPTVTGNKFIFWNYSFSGPNYIYLFNNNHSRIKCKICSKLSIEAPDFVLVSLFWIYLTYCSSIFFSNFEHVIVEQNTLLP